jgi:hypothetical protein
MDSLGRLFFIVGKNKDDFFTDRITGFAVVFPANCLNALVDP